MAFADVTAAAAERILDRLGDGAATYRHTSGTEAAITLLLDASVEVPDPSGQFIERVRMAFVRHAQITETPAVGDQITHGTNTWYVQRIVSDDGIVAGLAVA